MRALMLSWEYPPRVVGGLGRHVGALAPRLAALGHDVTVVTRDHPDAPADAVVRGVRVVRVPEAPPRIPFEELVPWVLGFNSRVQAVATRLATERAFDVVHAHDWLVAYAAIGLRDAFGTPLVATVHATELGRHQGWLPGPMNHLIHRIESWFATTADRVLVCSTFMREQVASAFDLPASTITVVPNGVAAEDFALPDDEVRRFRRTLAADGVPVVLFAGRLEYEKGVQTMIAALRRLRDAVGPVRALVAGAGTYAEELRRLVDALDLGDTVTFTGFLGDHELRLHYAAADVVVAPSIYEPFGLVAVEAMACGTPVVVSDTGGLREIVAGGHGLSFPPEDADALADRVLRLLGDAELAADLVRRARERIARAYDWHDVAAATAAAYADACAAAPEGPVRPVLRLVDDEDRGTGRAG